LKIGIFGKSGSGKSTVAGFFEKIGFFVIDLDVVGKEVLNKYPERLKHISESFGQEFVVNGVLDRKKLGSVVFSDENKLNLLNSIFFEYIRKDTLKIMKTQDKCVIDGAVLIDIGLQKYLDCVIYVKTSRDIAIERLTNREHRPETELSMRLDSQTKYDKQAEYADFIIETDNDPSNLKKSISDIFSTLKIQHGNSI
jgi:dephospho-CoA kinase